MLRIASLRFSSPLVLAPLAGYSDLSFRLLCRRFGAGYGVSEMISCHGLVYRQPATLAMLQSVPEERPVSFQLFGADAGAMAEAAQIVAEHRPDMLDINMGCPVKKVTKRGAGAALMAEPARAEAIITAVTRRVALPVTVKIRSGPDRQRLNAVEFAKMAEAAGAAAVTIHARTWAQGFSGDVDWQVIAAVKRALTIPVLGNGDITSPAEAQAMLAETGCDGVMIGRAALGNPWIFHPDGRPSSLAEIIAGAKQHLQLIERFLPAERLLGLIKNHLCRYFRGLPGSSALPGRCSPPPPWRP
jgi:tRNA-dihydrouridine synthase B